MKIINLLLLLIVCGRKQLRQMSKRIRYNKKQEPFLSYQNPEQYLKESQSFTLPTNCLILVKHLNEFSLFLEVLLKDVFQHTDPEQDNQLANALMREGRMKIDLEKVYGLSWNWFLEIDAMKGEMTGRLANARLLSWSQSCSLFYLFVLAGDREQERELFLKMKGPASKFCYCSMLLSKGYNIEITERALLEYTLDELWMSIRLIIPTLYRHPYDKDMREYFYALLYRYAAFFTQTQTKHLDKLMDNPRFYKKESDHIGEEEEDDDSDEDEEAYDSYKKEHLSLGEGYWLRTEYFYEGEVLFKPQMRRFQLSLLLEETHSVYRLILPEEITPSRMTLVRNALVKMLVDLSTNGELRQSVSEAFKKNCLSLYLYHGEVERFKREYPNMNPRASEIIAQARPSDLKHATKVISSTIVELLKDPSMEKEMILSTKIIIHQYLLYKGIKKAHYFDKYFLMEELTSLDQLEELIDKSLERKKSEPRSLPLLVTLMSTYYVIHEGFLYKSYDFCEVIMIWLSILVERIHYIPIGKVYPSIKEFIKYFVPLP